MLLQRPRASRRIPLPGAAASFSLTSVLADGASHHRASSPSRRPHLRPRASLATPRLLPRRQPRRRRLPTAGAPSPLPLAASANRPRASAASASRRRPALHPC